MIKRYDPSKDEIIELTQEYFDMLEAKYLRLAIYLHEKHPEIYREFIVAGNKNVQS
jgi:hypothetical protein